MNAKSTAQMTLPEAAGHFLKCGLSVLPSRGDKRPLIKWEAYQKNCMTEEEAGRFFTSENAVGIGIICGHVSGNLEVIDIDCKNDSTGELWKEFYTLLKEGFPELLGKLVIARTINKGYHLYYRCSIVEGSKQLSRNINKEVLVETRGEGAYVIASPTEGYSFVQGDPSSIAEITPDERLTLLSIASGFDELPEKADITGNEWLDGGISAFEDYNRNADVFALLQNHSWRIVKEKGERVFLSRPGKTGDCVSASYHKGLRVFYPFTTSSAFTANKGYNPVQVYTVLEADNDYSRASGQLREAGYGSRPKQPKEKAQKTKPLDLLPIEGFPPFIQNFINTCTTTYGTPRDYWAGAVLTSTALAIGNKLELVTRYNNLPIFWIVLVGDVSSGKSHPLAFCLKYFQAKDYDSIRRWRVEMDEYERISKMSDKERIKKGISEIDPKPKCPQYLLNEFTPEAMAAAHSANPRGLLIYRDELRGMIDDYNRYHKSGEQSLMVSLWSGIGSSKNTIKDGATFIENPCISISGSIQPELLHLLAEDSRYESGYLSRMCTIYPDHTSKPKFKDEIVPDEHVQQWEQFLEYLTSLPSKTVLKLSPEAKQLYGKWFDMNAGRCDNEPTGFLKGVYGKLDIIALRTAILIRGMNLACEGEYSEEISGEEMRTALEITEHFLKTARKVFNTIFGASPYIADKKAVIGYQLQQGKSVKSIAKNFNTSESQVRRVREKLGIAMN